VIIRRWEEQYTRGDVPNLEGRIDLMQTEIDDLQKALAEAEAERDELQREQDENAQRYQEEIQALAAERDALRRAGDKQANILDFTRKERDALQHRKNRLASDNEDLLCKLNACEKHAKSWTDLVSQCQLSGEDLDVRYLKNERDALRKELSYIAGISTGQVQRVALAAMKGQHGIGSGNF